MSNGTWTENIYTHDCGTGSVSPVSGGWRWEVTHNGGATAEGVRTVYRVAQYEVEVTLVLLARRYEAALRSQARRREVEMP